MGDVILKHPEDGSFMIFSSVSDSVKAWDMTMAELRTHLRQEYGRVGLEGWERGITRADVIGTSSMRFSRDEIVGMNRSGPDGEALSSEAFWRAHAGSLRTDVPDDAGILGEVPAGEVLLALLEQHSSECDAGREALRAVADRLGWADVFTERAGADAVPAPGRPD